MAHEKLRQSDSLDRFEQVERSKNAFIRYTSRQRNECSLQKLLEIDSTMQKELLRNCTVLQGKLGYYIMRKPS